MMPQEVIEILTSNIDTLWVIDCAILVFIMQAGFMCMETGLSESLNDKGEEIGIDGSIEIIEENYNKDTSEQLDKITKSVINISQNRNLSDDLTLITIGK